MVTKLKGSKERSDTVFTPEMIEELGIGSPNFEDFERPEARDKECEYRWCSISKIAYFKMKKYIAVPEDECRRLKPFYGEFVDGAWHLFKEDPKTHKILMKCSKKSFALRRQYYGNMAKQNIANDKENLAEEGRKAWKKGDSIGPDQAIIDNR